MNKIKILFLLFVSFSIISPVSADDSIYSAPVVIYNPIDSTKFASMQMVGSGYILIIDGKKQDGIIDEYGSFSYDNSGSLYMTLKQNGKWSFIENGKKSDTYDYLNCYYIEGFYCIADKGDKGYLINKSVLQQGVYDSNESNGYYYYNFDESGKNNWIQVKKGGKTIIVLNGKEINFGNDSNIRLNFTKNGEKYLISGADDKGFYVIIRGKKVYYYAGGIMKGEKIVFIIHDEKNLNTFYYCEYDISTNKIVRKKVSDVSDIFSLSIYGDHYVYIKTLASGGNSVIIDGKESGVYNNIYVIGSTSDNKYILFNAEKDGITYLLVNLKEYKDN